jgi:hypothetical protein
VKGATFAILSLLRRCKVSIPAPVKGATGDSPSRLTEYDKNGKPVPVYTGIWGNNKRDAKVFDNKSFAETFADMIVGEVIAVEMKAR